MIPIGGLEEFLDHSEILVLVQCPIFVGVGLPEFPCRYRGAELPPIEGAVMIAIERVEPRASSLFDLV